MHRSSWLFRILFVTLFVLTACGTSAPAGEATKEIDASAGTSEPTAAPVDSLSGTLAISGAFALYPMMTVWAEEYQKLHPNVEFDVQGGGAGKGMTDVLAGAVDIGMISRAIKPEEEAQGAYWVAVTKDAVFPIMSASNPVAAEITAKGISQATFKKVFITGEYKTWGDVVGKPEITDEIHVFTRSDASGAAEMWAKFSGGKVQDDLKGVGVNGEPALVDTVSKDPLAIGFANLGSTFDLTTGALVSGVIVVPIDANENGAADANEYYKTKDEALAAVANGDYPSPPARFENLATKGKPTGLALAFISWIVTDGQQFLEPSGFVELTAEQQAESLAKLK
jgi:phosphate transport system substrate-binding protein